MPESELRFGDENPLAAEIRKVLGVGPYDKISVVTPQFERPGAGSHRGSQRPPRSLTGYMV